MSPSGLAYSAKAPRDALVAHAVGDRAVGGQRVAAAGFGVAAEQRLVVAVQEQQPHVELGLLAQAGTVGFSVYLAETRMTDADWRAFGAAIVERGIATRPG